MPESLGADIPESAGLAGGGVAGGGAELGGGAAVRWRGGRWRRCSGGLSRWRCGSSGCPCRGRPHVRVAELELAPLRLEGLPAEPAEDQRSSEADEEEDGVERRQVVEDPADPGQHRQQPEGGSQDSRDHQKAALRSGRLGIWRDARQEEDDERREACEQRHEHQRSPGGRQRVDAQEDDSHGRPCDLLLGRIEVVHMNPGASVRAAGDESALDGPRRPAR